MSWKLEDLEHISFSKAAVTVYSRCIVCFCFFHAGVLKKVRDDMEVTAAKDKAATDLVLQSTEVIHIPYLITNDETFFRYFFKCVVIVVFIAVTQS